MYNESNSRSRSVSLRGSSRNRLGKSWLSEDNDNRLLIQEDHTKLEKSGYSRAKSIGSLWLLVPLLLLLATHTDRHLVLENYIPAVVYGLVVCGSLLFCVSFSTAWYHARKERGNQSVKIRPGQSSTSNTIFAFAKAHIRTISILLGAAAGRIILQILFVGAEQCLVPGIEGCFPLIYVLWKARKPSKDGGSVYSHSRSHAFLGGRLAEHFRQDIQSAVLLGLSAWTTSAMTSHPRSTMFCESHLAAWMLVSQFLSIGLDLCIFISLETCLEELSRLEIASQSSWSLLIGMLCLACGPFIFILSLVFKLQSGLKAFEALDLQAFKAFAWEYSIFLLAVLLAGSFLSSGKIMTLLSGITGVFVAVNVLSSLGITDGFSFVDYAQIALAFGCVSGAFKIHRSPRTVHRGRSHVSPSRADHVSYLIVIAGAVTLILTAFPGFKTEYQDHPIDALILAADQAHESWATQAKGSETLQEAVAHYKTRYNRLPPPNFHIWYNFAIARNSDVIDDYDCIERDLAPFRSLSPTKLRDAIREAVDDPFNEIGVIKIRQGIPSVDQKFQGHVWMMDVMVLMMEYFMSSLPDMDIPFNINDEPRVVVPHGPMQQALSLKQPSPPDTAAKNWSSNTGALLDEPYQVEGEATFENWSFKNNFKKFSTLSCAPDSAARRTKTWFPARLCLWCAAPHNRLDFVDDWKRSGDPCHQPDLGTMHGFYQGTGSYKVTKKLLPVFSASKPQGYADILYPSIWGWDDGQRSRYSPNKDYPAPGYADKSTTLFWRGSTSEGFATDGKWRTFSRQRFVYMADQASQAQPVYLPASKGSKTYGFKTLSKKRFLRHPMIKDSGLYLDVGFTAIEKATDDWNAEARVFKTVESEDFQAHWQHKYLMSLDEGAASRTFIPFVQSNSLPFRATIYQEWFDDRLTAWKHFVPLDLRFRGLWSTLGYFAGGFGTTRSTDGMDAGEYIAESGRLWGSRTLRRDDMEIYLFRLLLEWGRLLDDQRDELGFQE